MDRVGGWEAVRGCGAATTRGSAGAAARGARSPERAARARSLSWGALCIRGAGADMLGPRMTGAEGAEARGAETGAECPPPPAKAAWARALSWGVLWLWPCIPG